MNYTVILLPDPEGEYTAVVPALPGCISEGGSVDETLDMVSEAISLYLESAEKHNEEVPVEQAGTLVGVVDLESGRHWAREVSISPQSLPTP